MISLSVTGVLVISGTVAALTATAAFITKKLLERKVANDQQKAENARIESEEKINKSLTDSIDLLIEIEKIRYFLTEEKARSADQFARQTERLSESLKQVERIIDGQLEKIDTSYEVLVDAGNAKKLDDDTYELIDLPGLTAAEERLVRGETNRVNTYIKNSRENKDKIKEITSALEKMRNSLTITANSTAPELLEQSKSPEPFYRETLQKIVDSYQSEQTENSEHSSPEIHSESEKKQLEADQKSLQEGTEETKENTTKEPRETTHEDPRKRILEFAKGVQKSTPKKEEQNEIGMGE